MAVAALAVVAGSLLIAGNILAFSQTAFELDKNATNDLVTEHLGTLKSKLNGVASATSTVVCERQYDITDDNINNPVVVPIPAVPFTILIDGEQLTVTTLGATTSTGGCGFTDPADSTAQARTWTVTRAVNSTTLAAHSGGSDVTWMNQETTPADTPPGDDWDQVHAQVTADTDDTGDDDKCIALGAVECVWAHDDFHVTVFTTGGSKDDLNINPIAALNEPGTGWKWTDSSVPPSDEILDAFAIKYANGDQLLFFGADRWTTNGAKDFGFWFFHDQVGLCPDAGPPNCTGVPDGQFFGNHTRPTATSRGDLLLLGTFTQGGAIATVRAYEWVGEGGDTNGTLDFLGAFGDCAAGGGSPDGCNTVNNTTVPAPWPYQGGNTGNVSGSLYSGALLEGGINLTDLGLEGCFASFMAETRSSPEPGAQLKDFSLGNFESCGATLQTTPVDATGNPLTNSGGTSLNDVSIGTGSVQVKDKATLNVTGTTTFTGTLSFFICGPIDPALCTSDGVSAGSQPANANGTYTSNAVTLTEVGRYCWRGEWTSPTPGLTAGASDSSVTECFEVLPVTPTLVTTAVEQTVGLSPTIYGSKADLNGSGTVTSADDSAAFYGDTSIIDGQLDCDNWTSANHGAAGDGVINGDDDCTMIGYDGTSDGVTIGVVNGDFATADPDGGGPDPAVAIANGTPLPTVFPDPTDPNNPDVGDSFFAWSTDFGRVDANGDETIDGDDCHVGIIGSANILGENCGFSPSPPAYLNGFVDLNGDSLITPADACSNGCFFGHNVFNGLVATGLVDFVNPVFDVAVLRGTATQPGTLGLNATYPSINPTVPGLLANEQLTLTLLGPDPLCDGTDDPASGTGTNPQIFNVAGDGIYITSPFTPAAPGTYHWTGSYEGDSPNTNGTSHNDACGEASEAVTVRQIPTEIKTKQSWYPNDTATITSSILDDLLGADGTVDFYLYDNDTCSGSTLYSEQQTLDGGSHSEEVATSNYPGSTAVEPDGTTTVTPYAVTTDYDDTAGSTAGPFYWKVVYTPDDTDTAHTGIQSACGAEQFSITYTNDPGPGTDL